MRRSLPESILVVNDELNAQLTSKASGAVSPAARLNHDLTMIIFEPPSLYFLLTHGH